MNPRFLPALILLFLSACTVYKEYPIEVYTPGEAPVPSDTRKVAVIYRNFKYPGDTLLHFYRDDSQLMKSQSDPVELDSLLVATCLNKLAASLKNNQSFSEVRILPYHTFKRHTGEELIDLPADLAKQIANASGTDLILSLETFSSFFSGYPVSFGVPKASEVVTVAVWSIYDPQRSLTLERKTMIDTIYWNGYDNKGNYLENYAPPPRLNALHIAAALSGENYAKRFYATWQTVDRMYSVPPLPDFSGAAYYFEEGELGKAIILWKKYSDEKSGKLAINARYNLALAYELKDDLLTAQKWLAASLDLAQKHRSSKDIRMIKAYQKVLEKRIKVLETVEQ
ncbi:hypothetical protein D1164_20735 [Mariniphaga sediminis]|uniref:Uncharacterized protein n=1 Tax=Mariniphaga sediminis TaxID=1628158 RepID=A0A399CY08_9BACT|nr:DUF6340 family protein [Mariniphaga sediminis]RIH63281.1 hypothetical protein D1164_20735 [Mariniphaga sediminis]